jgi:hypothetical protein
MLKIPEEFYCLNFALRPLKDLSSKLSRLKDALDRLRIEEEDFKREIQEGAVLVGVGRDEVVPHGDEHVLDDLRAAGRVGVDARPSVGLV